MSQLVSDSPTHWMVFPSCYSQLKTSASLCSLDKLPISCQMNLILCNGLDFICSENLHKTENFPFIPVTIYSMQHSRDISEHCFFHVHGNLIVIISPFCCLLDQQAQCWKSGHCHLVILRWSRWKYGREI